MLDRSPTAYDRILPAGVAIADSRIDLDVPLFSGGRGTSFADGRLTPR